MVVIQDGGSLSGGMIAVSATTEGVVDVMVILIPHFRLFPRLQLRQSIRGGVHIQLESDV